MELTGLSGGIMLALAAALWLAYLLPNWFKRREYLATERNAVRLQQTIRVLAETAEVPAEVRAEAAARRLAQQQRAEFRQGPVAVGRPVQRPQPLPDARALAARRRRRARALATLVLLASLVIAVVQLILIVSTGAVPASWLVLLAAGAAAVGSVTMLGRLAAVARTRAAIVEPAARRTSRDTAQAVVRQQQAAPWTPVPVPKPLYLSRSGAVPARPAASPAANSAASSAAQAAAVQDAAVQLERAAASAERALRAAERETTPITPAASAPAASVPAPAARSRFASMGIVDAASTAAPDLDAALARRRRAG